MSKEAEIVIEIKIRKEDIKRIVGWGTTWEVILNNTNEFYIRKDQDSQIDRQLEAMAERPPVY